MLLIIISFVHSVVISWLSYSCSEFVCLPLISFRPLHTPCMVATGGQDAGFGLILYINWYFSISFQMLSGRKMAGGSIGDTVAHFSRCQWLNRLLHVAFCFMHHWEVFWEESLLLRVQTPQLSYHMVVGTQLKLNLCNRSAYGKSSNPLVDLKPLWKFNKLEFHECG